ncbi:MAG: DUF302 domain-containing protein [Marinilabiliaceae bacterium]|jgi:uncharacterized protein (DUF302 family)|nr:DUF302 domain-containing protein [Marinilabiliaceae bacterium]
MSYYFNTTLENISLAEARTKIEDELKKEGFGIISEIDVSKTLKTKIDVDFKEYLILGACNPRFAHQALSEEDKIGLLLPCNVVLSRAGENSIEVSAIDPVASMSAVDNKKLVDFAENVRESIKSVFSRLK